MNSVPRGPTRRACHLRLAAAWACVLLGSVAAAVSTTGSSTAAAGGPSGPGEVLGPYACDVRVDGFALAARGAVLLPSDYGAACAAELRGRVEAAVTGPVLRLVTPGEFDASMWVEVFIGESVGARHNALVQAATWWACHVHGSMSGDMEAVLRAAGWTRSPELPHADGAPRGVWAFASALPPPAHVLLVCTSYDGASVGWRGALREFLVGAVERGGAGVVHVFDVGASPSAAAARGDIDDLDVAERVVVSRAPPGLRSATATAQTCMRLHAAARDVEWVLYMDVRERIVMPRGGTLSDELSEMYADADALVLPVIADEPSPVTAAATHLVPPSGAAAPRAGIIRAPAEAAMRSAGRPERGAGVSAALPCVEDETRLHTTTPGWGPALRRCNCLSGRVACGVEAWDDASVRRQPHIVAAPSLTRHTATSQVSLAAAAERFPDPAESDAASARCERRAVAAAVAGACDGARILLQSRDAPGDVDAALGVARSARGAGIGRWFVARRSRAPRLGYVTYVYGDDAALTLSRLAFTIASLRAVGATSDIMVLIPGAAWVDAGRAALRGAGSGVSFKVVDFAHPPHACVAPQDDRGVYGTRAFWGGTYMQLAGFLRVEFDAFAYLDALDVLITAPLEPALAAFDGDLEAAFAALPDKHTSCRRGAYMQVGVTLARPSRALYRFVDSFPEAYPRELSCHLAVQDLLNAAVPRGAGPARVRCLTDEVHCLPSFGQDPCPAAGEHAAAVIHFAGEYKPWSAPGALERASPACRALIDVYNARFRAWNASEASGVGAAALQRGDKIV